MCCNKLLCVVACRKWRCQPAVCMHDAGFYPDLEHVVQPALDDDPSRSTLNAYPALLKDPTSGGAKTPGAESVVSGGHCCSVVYGGDAGNGGGPLYWDGRRTPLYWAPGDGRRTPRPAAYHQRGGGGEGPPGVTTLVAADGTLLRSMVRRGGDHFYESAGSSYAGGRCPLQTTQDAAVDDLGGPPTSVVYYEVDAAGEKAVTRTPLISAAVTADLVAASRAQQQSVI